MSETNTVERPRGPVEAEGRNELERLVGPLFVPLRSEYYEAFSDGTKHDELRLYGPRWNERTCAPGRDIVLSKGYGKRHRMTGRIWKFKRQHGSTFGSTYKAAILDCYGTLDIWMAVISVTDLRPNVSPLVPKRDTSGTPTANEAGNLEIAMQERNHEVHPVGNKDKIERYDWKLLDQPGELRMLNKKVLRIDEQYQRDATEPKVKEIARAWSWLACGALLVAEREGVYFVFDGQHRALAAMRRSDIEKLPCVVFRTAGSKEEAEAFLRANKNRKPLNGLAKFRAATAAEQPAATLVQQLISASGRTASEASSGTTVRCLALMMNHAERQPDVLKRVWPLIAEVCNGKPVHERVMDGLLYVENHLPEGESLMDKEWRKRVLRVSYDGLLGAANRFAAAYSKGGAKVWGLGMVEAMNKGCRTHMKLAGNEEG